MKPAISDQNGRRVSLFVYSGGDLKQQDLWGEISECILIDEGKFNEYTPLCQEVFQYFREIARKLT